MDLSSPALFNFCHFAQSINCAVQYFLLFHELCLGISGSCLKKMDIHVCVKHTNSVHNPHQQHEVGCQRRSVKVDLC